MPSHRFSSLIRTDKSQYCREIPYIMIHNSHNAQNNNRPVSNPDTIRSMIMILPDFIKQVLYKQRTQEKSNSINH